MTVPGIGKGLALTIMLDSSPIEPFPTAGDCRPYCRCMPWSALSNGKKKGENNPKSGNRYLCWACFEASNYMRRYCPETKRWHQRRLSRSMHVVAPKAVTAKICKACCFIMREQVRFDARRIFGVAVEPARL